MPNGEITSSQLRTLGTLLKPYGDELGVGDITSRANFQLRGIPMDDADMVCKAVQECGLSNVMSGELSNMAEAFIKKAFIKSAIAIFCSMTQPSLHIRKEPDV